MSAKLIQVIEARHTRGHGRDASDPVRVVVSYYALDGTLLAEYDSFAEAADAAEPTEPPPPETGTPSRPWIGPGPPPPESDTPRSFRFLDGQPHDFDCSRLLPENRQGNYTICCKAEADRQKAAGG